MWPFNRNVKSRKLISPVASSGGDGFEGVLARHLIELGASSGDFPVGSFGIGPTRNTAVTYTAFNRCITLISGVAAQLICGGNLQVIDRRSKRVVNRRTGRVLDLLSESIDGGATTSSNFIEDVVSDYCIDGNGIMVPTFDSSGIVKRLRRFRPWDATISLGRSGQRMYGMTDADFESNGLEYFSAHEVIHCRWPRLLRYGLTSGSRDGFALSPFVALKTALGIGLGSDKFVEGWFERGPKTKTHVNYKTPENKAAPTQAQRQELADWIAKLFREDKPLVTFDAETSTLDDRPQDTEALELRNFQVEEIARFYGIPLPLLSVPVRQYGAAFNEQISKLAYRWGVSIHVNRILMPMSQRLLAAGERFLIDPIELVRGDSSGIKDMIESLRGDAQREPIASISEMRHASGLPRDSDGEIRESPWGVDPKEKGNRNEE